MPDQRNARPVSGEIMAAAPCGPVLPRAEPCFDIVDAEFETLDGRAGNDGGAARYLAALQSGPMSGSGLAALRGHRSERAMSGSARAGAAFWIAGVCAAAVAFWISGGHVVVRQASFLSPAATAEPLRIADLNTRVDAAGGRATLSVDGQAVNDGDDTQPMPPLKIDVVANDGVTTRYNLGTSGSPIGPGEIFAFASRLPAPTNGVESVSVTLAGKK